MQKVPAPQCRDFLNVYGSVGIIEIADAVLQIVGDHGLHFIRKGAGIADGRAVADAGGKADRVRAALHQLPHAENGFLSGQILYIFLPQFCINV